MTAQELEERLDYEASYPSGFQWGFQTEAGAAAIGYIFLRKQKPKPVTPIDPAEDPDGYRRWQEKSEEMRRTPYHVHVAEVVRRDLSASGAEYPETEDYRILENYYFGTLEGVEQILERYGQSLAEIQPRSSLRLP